MQTSLLRRAVSPVFHRLTNILARLAASKSSNMALTVVEETQQPTSEPAQQLTNDIPPVTTTTCDPWPQPYYLEDGLRKVTPYHYTYNTYCKERWRGRTLIDVFSDEFRDRPLSYYKGAIEEGRVTLDGKPTTIDSKILNGMVISHTLHRHEPPVSAQPIGIVHEDEDMIVINKPAGIPVHPAGRYRHNSVVEIMRADRGQGWNPMPCNRLDRLTSGLMFVGKHAKAAEEMGIQLRTRTIKKEYIARVIGEFPAEDIICDQPILQISPKLGLNRARASGKEAKTIFKRLAYYPPPPPPPSSSSSQPDPSTPTTTTSDQTPDPKTPWSTKTGYSIIRCLPLTGRTHQLRVHLQFLGHPISNDPIYCNQRVFGPSLASGDNTAQHDTDIVSRLSRMGKEEIAEARAYHEEMMSEYQKRKAEKRSGRCCVECGTELYSDPGAHELGIYLHARKYECEEGRWAYETALPGWALPPDGMDGGGEIQRGGGGLLAAEVERGTAVLNGASGVVVSLEEEVRKLKVSEEARRVRRTEVPEGMTPKEFRRSLWAHPGGV